jgi:hypothetical protein
VSCAWIGLASSNAPHMTAPAHARTFNRDSCFVG